jgi:hypothetical protein
MIKHFTEFQGQPNRSDRDQPRVTLNARGVFLLNKKAYDAMEQPGAVTLLFDENNKVIGLRPADPRLKNAFSVKQKDKWNNRTINASPFCKHFGIRVQRTVLFNEVDLTDDGVLLLELTKTTSIGQGSY